MKFRLTKTNLSAMLVAMPIAMCVLLALSVFHALRGRIFVPVFLPAYAFCVLVLCGGMFVGAAVIWRVRRDAPAQTLIALATPGERVLWIGGSFAALPIVGALALLDLKGAPWAHAFVPMMISVITAPSIAMISAGRRFVASQIGG